jgi:hypothetical protein
MSRNGFATLAASGDAAGILRGMTHGATDLRAATLAHKPRQHDKPAMQHSENAHHLPATDAVLARCAEWIANEPELAATLAMIVAADEFRDALLAMVTARAGAEDAAALALLRFDRPLRAGHALMAWPLTLRRGWQPLALEWGAQGAELVWGCGATRDDLPFHESAVASLRQRPLNQWFATRTPLTPAFVAALEADMLPLSGLILHMSRCGSTLIAQTLKAWPGNRVLSEPGLLDTALTVALAGGDPDWLAFRGVLAALRQPAGADRRVLLKLDAWHALALAQLRMRLPAVPWLFAYRDPLEVLVSQARESGRHMLPGMLPEPWLGHAFATDESLPPIEHAAHVLGAICAAVLPHASAGYLVNHAELAARDGDAQPPILIEHIPRWFGLDPFDADPTRLATTLAQHAKRPQEGYTDDRAGKREAATADLRAAVDRWIAAPYAALEATRSDRRA